MKWTKYLSLCIYAHAFEECYENFTTPIIAGLHKDRKPVPKAACYVEQGAYARLLENLHKGGLIAWRLDKDLTTPLSYYTCRLKMILFEITKEEIQERIISWTRIANELCAELPSPDIPEHRNFTSPAVHRSSTTPSGEVWGSSHRDSKSYQSLPEQFVHMSIRANTLVTRDRVEGVQMVGDIGTWCGATTSV